MLQLVSALELQGEQNTPKELGGSWTEQALSGELGFLLG